MKKILSIIFIVFAVCTIGLFAGCKNQLSKEEIACKMICYVAEEYGVEPSRLLLKSGRLEEENGDYFANFLVSLNGYKMYFTGTYYTKNEEIEYKDMTEMVESLGAGSYYYDTKSFNIDKVNNELQKIKEN